MQRGRFLKEGGRDERMARMIGAVPGGVMMVAVVGRGIIIITGPPCQSRSGNLWVSGWVGGSPSGAQNLPRTPDRERKSLLLSLCEHPHLHEHIYSADRDMSQ